MEHTKKQTLYDLIIVLAVTILPPLLRSIQMYAATGSAAAPLNASGWVTGILQQILGLSLVFYVLYNRNKTYKDIGIRIHWQDILIGLLVFVCAAIIYVIVSLLVIIILPEAFQADMKPKNIEFASHFSWLFVVYVIINPFFEEIIVRGFAMTQLLAFTKSKVFVVIFSTLLQTSYHIYQGGLPMFTMSFIFLSFSIFYVKTGKLTPVIIAHLIFDLLILTRL